LDFGAVLTKQYFPVWYFQLGLDTLPVVWYFQLDLDTVPVVWYFQLDLDTVPVVWYFFNFFFHFILGLIKQKSG
jgi:hypothetical protein